MQPLRSPWLLALVGACATASPEETGDTKEETDTPSEQTETDVAPIEEPSDPDCTPEPFPPAWSDDDGYQRFMLCGWTIHMASALADHEFGDAVYTALGQDLIRVIDVLPTDAVVFLRGTHLWLELDVPAFPGGVYHPSAQWLQENGYPTRWAEGVQLGNAANYLSWVAQQPAMVLHEFSHAWDHQQHGYANAAVLAAYDEAMAAGRYDAVRYIEGQTLEAYATTNAAEYFAELSEAWFWSNDYYPFGRAELELHDPTGAAAIVAAWGIP